MKKLCLGIRLRWAWLLALVFPLTLLAGPPAASTETLRLPGGTDVALSVFPAQGATLLIWLPSESGVVAAEHKTAAALARSGIEVWLPDLHAAYFLPVVPSSLQQMPARDVAGVIAAGQQRGKAVYLASAGNGAALALQAAAELRNGANPCAARSCYRPTCLPRHPNRAKTRPICP